MTQLYETCPRCHAPRWMVSDSRQFFRCTAVYSTAGELRTPCPDQVPATIVEDPAIASIVGELVRANGTGRERP